MPFDLQGARKEGYGDTDILTYLAGKHGIPADFIPGQTDEERIQLLLDSLGKSMLPYEYADSGADPRRADPAPATADPLRSTTGGDSGVPPTPAALPRPVPRQAMPPEAVQQLWAEGKQGMQPELLPTSLWDVAVNNPISEYLGELIGAGAQKLQGALPEDWAEYALPATLTGLMLGPHAVRPGPRGRTGETLRAAQVERLEPGTLENLHRAMQSSPELAEAAPYLTPFEAAKTSALSSNVAGVQRLLELLPAAEKMAALAKAGRSKRGWYRGSAQAILDTFGADDAPRFAQLLASMSPQTSVESNLINALKTWANWDAAGRPADPDQIRAIMGRSVQGGKGEASILPAWINNSVMVLGSPDPRPVTLSGPKVDSFYRNLVDDVYRVTLDAWMSNAFGQAPDWFAGSGSLQQLLGGDPGMGPGYIGTSARVRQAADMAGMYPSEAQETIWSVAMRLYEMARNLGVHPREVLERGLLTPAEIRGTPDFSTLFRTDPEIRGVLAGAGLAPPARAFRFPDRERSIADLTLGEQRHVEEFADILGRTAELRGLEAGSRALSLPAGRAETAYPVETSTLLPSRASGHLPELARGGAYHTGRIGGLFEDLQGRDVLQQGAGLPSLSRQSVEGGSASTARAPVTQSGEVNLTPEARRQLLAAAALRGAMTGQERAGYTAAIPSRRGTDYRVPLENKAGAGQMATARREFPEHVFRDTGAAIDIGTLGKGMTEDELARVRDIFSAGQETTVKTVGDFVDYAQEWAQQPGSQAVTRKMLTNLNRLGAEQRASLDAAVRRPAGDLLRYYERSAGKKNPARGDLMNLLRILRDGGFAQLERALRSKKQGFLPALAGAVILPALLRGEAPQER